MKGVIDMYGAQSSDRKSANRVRRALGHVWADVIHAQRRAAELNTPWIARRRSSDQH